MGKNTKIYFFEKENFGLYFVIGVLIVIIVAGIGKCHTENKIIENIAFSKGIVTDCS